MKRFTFSRLFSIKVALSLSLLLATACKKEEDVTPGDTKPSCLLTKEDRSQSSYKSETSLKYDASGRIESSSWTTTSSNGAVFISKFERNSADNRVNKVVDYSGDKEFHNSVFEYDAQGRWVKTTSTNIPLTQNNKVIEAEYDSQGRIIKTTTISNSSNGSSTNSSTYEYKDGNLTKWTHHGDSYDSIYEFERYPDKLAVDNGEYHQVIGYRSGSGSLSKNLTKKVTLSYNGNTQIYDYTYEFNDKGFPTKITINGIYNGTAAPIVYTRSYICE